MKPALVTIHARRAGTGKTSLAANLAVVCAQQGLRVGLLDLDWQAPGLPTLFGLRSETVPTGLQQVSSGQARLEDAAQDVTGRLLMPASGCIDLLPAGRGIISPCLAGAAARLYAPLLTWASGRGLDLLLLDTCPGLEEDSLFWMGAADVLLLTLRLDQQDYQDTALLVEAARALNRHSIGLVVNNVPSPMAFHAIKPQVEMAFGVEVMAILPQAEDFLTSTGIHSSGHSDHPLTSQYLRLLEGIRRV